MSKCIRKNILVLLAVCIISIETLTGCSSIHKVDNDTKDLTCKCNALEYIEKAIGELKNAVDSHTVTIRELREANKELRRKYNKLKERDTPINVLPYPFVLYNDKKTEAKAIPLKIINIKTAEPLILKIGEEKDLLLESDNLDINDFQSKIIKIDMGEQGKEKCHRKVTITGIKHGKETLTFRNERGDESKITVKIEMPLTVLDENEEEVDNSKPFTVTCRERKIFVKSCGEALYISTDPPIQKYLYYDKEDKKTAEHHNTWPVSLKAQTPGYLSIILKNDIGEKETLAVKVE